MAFLLDLVLILVGCAFLYFGAEWLVNSASRLAGTLGIPKSVIGLTLVALGTSAPEFFVNVIAGFRGQTEFALSNASGSNLTNMCIGFGLCGFTTAIVIPWRKFGTDCLVLVASVVIVLGLLLFTFCTDPDGTPHIPFWGVLPLMAGLAVYLYFVGRRVVARDRDVEKPRTRWPKDIALFLAGVVALYAGGELVLRSAVSVAELLQINPALIGLTIVAAGTSVPDTIASLIAVRRKEPEIAVGNLLGSNISNIFVVLTGSMLANRISGQAGEMTASKEIVGDYATVVLVSIVIVTLSALMGGVGRKSSIVLFAIYAGYMCFRVCLEIFGGASA